MAFSIFGSRAADREAKFWDWFVTNQDRVFNFENDQEAVFDDLSEKLSKVDENLTFEFGPVSDGKREFIVSAGGISSSFSAVESLVAKAPPLSKWTLIKYRPRRLPPFGELSFGDKKVNSSDVRYLLAKDGDKVGIVLFFDSYTESEKASYGQIGFLFLDEALGEYAVETEVGFVEFHSFDSPYFAQSSPLHELPEHFDEHLARRKH